MKRKIVQILSAIITNSYWKGFAEGRIYTGNIKKICIPGLNCHSCPAALGACPIGSLQAVIGSIKYKFSFYVIGFLILFGSIFGRFICGWLCPFGLIQELFHKIPSPKWNINRKLKWLKYLKYIVLVIFVIALPMLWVNNVGLGDPTFCKYICPAGTLEAGIPLVLSNPDLKVSIGLLFSWKIILLIITIIVSIFLFRPFCSFICPLGAIYGLFNPISIYGLQIDANRCTKCGLCSQTCKLGIDIYKQPSSPECIRCGECIMNCPNNAITSTLSLLDNTKKNNSEKTFSLSQK
jgi:ferredoxin-type protein NapH